MTNAARPEAALVTGARRGIGRAVVRALSERGFRVAATDVDPGPGMLGLDVRSESDWTRVLREIGPFRLLVNAAGVASASPLAETSLDEWRRVHAVNLDGAFLATRSAVRSMGRDGGCVVHLASRAGIDAFPGSAAYASSKAALIHFTRVAALEAAPVRVCALAPGGVRSPMWRGTPLWNPELDDAANWATIDPRGEFHTEEEAAAAVLELADAPSGTVRVLRRS